MDTFIPAYLQSLCEHLAPFIPAEKLVSTLMSGTQAMLDNDMPDKALKEVFDQAFYPVLGIQEAITAIDPVPPRSSEHDRRSV